MLKETLCFVSMLFGHHTCPDEKALPVKSTSHHHVQVAYVHAANEHGKTHITGAVEKTTEAGSVSSAHTHLDITATQKGKVLWVKRTAFFPGTIPESRQGNRGRSTFDLTTKELPADAEITVVVHHQPLSLCKK